MKKSNILICLTLIILFGQSSTNTVQAQSLEKAKELLGSAIESKETRYKREQEEKDRLRMEEIQLRENLKQQQLELEQIQREKQALLGNAAAPKPQTPYSNTTEVFIASNCPDCQKMLGYLDALSISYRVKVLDKDPDAERQYLEQIGRGVIPVLRYRGSIYRGYQPSELGKLSQQPRKRIIRASTPSTQNELPKARGASTEPRTTNPVDEENQFDVSGSLE